MRTVTSKSLRERGALGSEMPTVPPNIQFPGLPGRFFLFVNVRWVLLSNGYRVPSGAIMHSYLGHPTLSGNSGGKWLLPTAQLPQDVFPRRNDSRCPLFGSLIVIRGHKNGNSAFNDLFRPCVNEILISSKQNSVLEPTVVNDYWIGDSGFSLAIFIVKSDDEKTIRAQHFRQFNSPESPIEEKYWRFFKLRLLSTRNLRSLL
jgi:hypothetical protein